MSDMLNDLKKYSSTRSSLRDNTPNFFQEGLTAQEAQGQMWASGTYDFQESERNHEAIERLDTFLYKSKLTGKE
jgi:hypothetical protein